MKINIILLVVMTLFSLNAVMARSLLKAVIALTFTSATITVLIFRLNSPIAAVFELSVCAGLITAVFVSTIAMTKPLSHQEILTLTKGRMKRYWFLPAILIITAIIMGSVRFPYDFQLPKAAAETSMNSVLWMFRQFDLLGQVVILLAGVFGIVVLFKEARKK